MPGRDVELTGQSAGQADVEEIIGGEQEMKKVRIRVAQTAGITLITF